MFDKILVPLDGSKLAECALAYAETLAKCCGAKVVALVSVTERVVGKTSAPEARELFTTSDQAGVAVAGNQTLVTFGKMETQAEKYLERLSKQLKAEGLPVTTAVLMGNPAEEITKYAEQQGIEVIVISSHGRTGPSRWAHGSVADKVFRASCVPVLMVRAPGCLIGT